MKKKLSDLGISKDQSSQYQKLADVPEKEFEEAPADPAPRMNGKAAALEEGASNLPSECCGC